MTDTLNSGSPKDSTVDYKSRSPRTTQGSHVSKQQKKTTLTTELVNYTMLP